MKTKHLFFAAALAASFTACTSEELVEVQQQGVATVERPTVENVQLNIIGEGVESRLLFNGEYAWEATDTIGALLMDTPWNLSADEWINQYRLQNYVNTSYPFTYSTEDKTWSCPGKMLEGNYFFAYPWSSYDGGRQMKHSLLTQSQKGIAGNVVAEALAENQLFIGYSQIKKGAAFDVLTDVEMTSVLGAVQFRIKNAGDKTYHINKVVLSSTNGYVWSELTFDPTKADYAGETLEDNTTAGADFCYAPWSNAHYFNYANYVGDEEAVGVYDITEANAKYYNKANALRKVVNKATGARGVAYLNVEGTEAERAVAPGATAYALIMVNPLTEAQADDVKITLYTDEGQIEFVKNLGSQYKLDNTMVAEVRPGVSNTVNLEFVDGDVKSPDAFSVYTEEDLAQYIDWMSTSPAGTSATVKLYADVELNAEMFNKMMGNTKVTWTFGNYQSGKNSELTLAEDVPAGALDYTGITYGTGVDLKVLGTVDVTAATKTRLANKTLNIAEGGKLNIKVAIDNAKVKLPTIINEGTVEISAIQIAAGAPAITNKAKGTVNVIAGADVKSAIVNYGKLNNNGYMESVTNGNSSIKDEAVINLGANAVLKGLINDTDAEVIAAAGSSVAGTNNGLVSCADNTVKINVTGGKVALEVTGAVAKDAYKDLKYNTLKIKGQTTFADIQTGIAHIITTDGSELKLAEAAAAYTLSLTSLEINGATTITTVLTGDKKNSVQTTNMVVKEGATLTNNGTFVVASVTATDWINEGLVINNQNATLPASATLGNWKYNAAGTYTKPADDIAYNINAVFNGGNLYDNIKNVDVKDGGLKNMTSNDAYKSLTINSNLNMADGFTVGSPAEDKTNADYKDVLTSAPVVYLNADITNLKEADGIELTKLVISDNATISGSAKMDVLKVTELVVDANKVLTIAQGNIVIDETAVLGKGSEKITVKGSVIGGEDNNIIGYTSEGEKLYWDYQEGEWVETSPTYDYSEATVDASTGETLAWAVENNVSEVTLTNNVIADEVLQMTGDMVLNLNGNTISAPAAAARAASDRDALIIIERGAKLTIGGAGTIDGGDLIAIKLTTAEDKANEGLAELVVNGGTIKSTGWFAISGNGNAGRENTKVTINGGTIQSNSTAIYQPQAGTMIINGGTVEGVNAAIELRAGDLTVNDGVIKSTASDWKYGQNGSGTTCIGAALAISQHTTKKDINVTIVDGEFTGAYAVRGQDENKGNNVAVTIKGGIFTATREKASTPVSLLSSAMSLKNNDQKVIEGGFFKYPYVKGSTLANFVKDGFEVSAKADADGYFEVVKSETETEEGNK